MQYRKLVCEVCGHVYDEALGQRWEELPEDWVCPECGAAKADFKVAECMSS